MPFEPGQSGNPNGRPKKGKTITDEVRKLLAESAESDTPMTKAQALAKVWLDKAMTGDPQTLKLLVEHLEGKAPQPIVGDEDSAPIKIESTEWKEQIVKKLSK